MTSKKLSVIWYEWLQLYLTIAKCLMLIVAVPLALVAELAARLTAWLLRELMNWRPVLPAIFQFDGDVQS